MPRRLTPENLWPEFYACLALAFGIGVIIGAVLVRAFG